MTWLVTGAAGFIGYHVAEALLALGETVRGIDNLNDYYSVDLKRARLARLANQKAFSFAECDIADFDSLRQATAGLAIRRVVHLAAQAGVRYSLTNPQAYVRANVLGHVNVLEIARGLEGCSICATPRRARSMAVAPICRSARPTRPTIRSPSTPRPSAPTN